MLCDNIILHTRMRHLVFSEIDIQTIQIFVEITNDIVISHRKIKHVPCR